VTYDRETWSKAAMYSIMHCERHFSSDEPSDELGLVMHLAKHWSVSVGVKRRRGERKRR
jgi:hypothetical protein